MRGKNLGLSIVLVFLAVSAWATSGWAYTTRIHMVLANKVRQKLVASTDNSIQLEKSGYRIVYSQEDADAIINYPAAFRAGAIGPDNFVFPALADASHAIGLSPFNQCNYLYEAAVNAEERAYALGCFLHGTSDAMAHHFVNYLGGETFTLNPLEAGRGEAWDNVIEHILAEATVQGAAVVLEPGAFAADQLLFQTPRGFVQRAYYQESSPVWQLASTHAREKLEAAQVANPGGRLDQIVLDAGLGPYEYIILMPVYLNEVDPLIEELRGFIQSELADMQDHNSARGADLLVLPGSDGVLGTEDDVLDGCEWTCPSLSSRYWAYVGLLEIRLDGNGNPLPSAFDKVAEDLRFDLFSFQEAYLTTVDNVAAALAAPIVPGEEGMITLAQVQTAIQPLFDWEAQLTNIDYVTLSQALLPAWLITLLDSIPGAPTAAELVAELFQPVIDQVRTLIRDYVIEQARAYLGDLLVAYETLKAPILADFAAKIDAAQNPDLGSTMLDNLFDSGLWVNSLNLPTLAMANRQLFLPQNSEWMGFGPASFDASHTAKWMQAAVCDYINPAVFPLGHDLVGEMSVQIGDVLYPAQIAVDSPIECHDGSLTEFTSAPGRQNCALVGLEELVNTSRGSMTRSFPPSAVGETVSCLNIAVDGLPEPPASGCGCKVAPRTSGSGAAWALLALVPAFFWTRRRRAARDLGAQRPAQRAPGPVGAGFIPDQCARTASQRVGAGFIPAQRAPRRASLWALLGALLFVASCGGGSSGQPDADINNPRGALIAALGNSTWNSLQLRGGVERAYEIQFRADSLLWAEVQNPYGPARQREMRQMMIDQDATVHTTVITPNGWPIPPNNGETGDWTMTVTPGNPRTLTISKMGGQTETFTEGAWPAPDGGLTAEVFVFPGGGTIANAFCESGFGGFDYPNLFNGARGAIPPYLYRDVVAGAPLLHWAAGNNFSVTDVAGFDPGTLGGTALSDQANFVVRYTGTITHPGGSFAMREQDDAVEDGVWVFLDQNVGSTNDANLFLEVQGFAWPDATDDAPSGSFAAGDLPVEIILYRCTMQLVDVDVEANVNGSGWQLVGSTASQPEINDVLFPPVF